MQIHVDYSHTSVDRQLWFTTENLPGQALDAQTLEAWFAGSLLRELQACGYVAVEGDLESTEGGLRVPCHVEGHALAIDVSCITARYGRSPGTGLHACVWAVEAVALAPVSSQAIDILLAAGPACDALALQLRRVVFQVFKEQHLICRVLRPAASDFSARTPDDAASGGDS